MQLPKDKAAGGLASPAFLVPSCAILLLGSPSTPFLQKGTPCLGT